MHTRQSSLATLNYCRHTYIDAMRKLLRALEESGWRGEKEIPQGGDLGLDLTSCEGSGTLHPGAHTLCDH